MAKPSKPTAGPARPSRTRRRAVALDPSMRLTLARAAAAYCLIAVVACLVFGWIVFQQRQAANAVVKQQQAAVNAVKPQADVAEAAYRELTEQQERNRQHYSGLEAIEMSTKVMNAKDQSTALRGQQQTAQKMLDSANEAERAAGLRFVPLIAILLVHALVLALIATANPGLLTTKTLRH